MQALELVLTCAQNVVTRLPMEQELVQVCASLLTALGGPSKQKSRIEYVPCQRIDLNSLCLELWL